MKNDYYTYAYLREDGTPYYIGKGRGGRAWARHVKWLPKPKNKSCILMLKTGLSEQEAFKHEIYMISILGRKDLGTGILHNRTDGGEGVSGHRHTESARKKMSKTKQNKTAEEKAKTAKKLSIIAKSQHKNRSPEEREAIIAKMVETNANKTKEEKAKINSKRSDSLKKTFELLKESRVPMPDERKTRISLSLVLAHKTMSEKEKIERALKISNSIKDLKWYIDPQGNTVRALEQPGPEWQRGRKFTPEKTNYDATVA